ncbi:hypothetical protein DNH61_13705 [Paenibacillus sambharensis]|uniref:Uncharacterized protein n=1 Tax=Paenibacillus sambharensis TaxID=1803190 RepID=A0A2W1LVP6_9BACL|nr:hypothetical protein [Paenibacillus sambharensis]PZD95577.1 hypothetical protein DNH61_13705 [Paenibacillus sambharensis]
MPRHWIRYPLLYLLVTAVTGLIIRSMFLIPSWQGAYSSLLHAHSHLALLGWAYSALLLLLCSRFLTAADQQSRFLKLNWAATQLTVIGMFAAFSLQGYGLFSIAFSTLHILLSYSFTAWFWRRLPRGPAVPVSVRCVKAALFYLVFSSVGPWSLAIMSAGGWKDSPWYDAAIYGYLHFQYNGWFTLAIFACIYQALERHGLPQGQVVLGRLHYMLYSLTLIPALLLSLLWMELPVWLNAAATAAAVCQFAAVTAFLVLLRDSCREGTFRQQLAGIPGSMLLWRLAILSLGIKMIMELLSSVPALETLAFSTRSVIIGYLHLVLLGFVTAALLALLRSERSGTTGRLQGVGLMWLGLFRSRLLRSELMRPGSILFAAGLTIHELLLFADGLCSYLGTPIPDLNALLLGASLAMLAGISLIAAGLWDWDAAGDHTEKHSA